MLFRATRHFVIHSGKPKASVNVCSVLPWAVPKRIHDLAVQVFGDDMAEKPFNLRSILFRAPLVDRLISALSFYVKQLVELRDLLYSIHRQAPFALF